jgi:hypothetical protein
MSQRHVPRTGGPRLLVAVSVDAVETEHVARATITLIQPLCRTLDVPVDLTAFVPSAVSEQALIAMRRDRGICQFEYAPNRYLRASGGAGGLTLSTSPRV